MVMASSLVKDGFQDGRMTVWEWWNILLEVHNDCSYYTVVLYKSFVLLAVLLYSALMQRLETRLHLGDSQLTKLQNCVEMFLFSFILH